MCRHRQIGDLESQSCPICLPGSTLTVPPSVCPLRALCGARGEEDPVLFLLSRLRHPVLCGSGEWSAHLLPVPGSSHNTSDSVDNSPNRPVLSRSSTPKKEIMRAWRAWWGQQLYRDVSGGLHVGSWISYWGTAPLLQDALEKLSGAEPDDENYDTFGELLKQVESAQRKKGCAENLCLCFSSKSTVTWQKLFVIVTFTRHLVEQMVSVIGL
ncbi:hypothetical protein DPEC_G00225560 [Dallia pectoralis]|uniref:Uncharacterized protein n=1 Tax=Dallia pectoralis TaxID=75939 RepID=A0ACC2G0P1_DALPE|nr:hypothetical protein DPEC_G00225560 [Dallia pectoralis]